MRRAAPAIALFFLSPLVAEFLLGDFTFVQLPLLVLLAPAYGGAAVVIREVARRTGRGWPAIVLLALAYGVLEEGLETQSLFNPDYVGAHLLDQGFVPALGIAIPWTIFVLTLHTVWSISTPIALVEEGSRRRTEPWLRTPGLTVAAVLAVLGGAGTFAVSYADGHFLASPAQLTVTAVIVAALVVAAFRLPRARPQAPGVPPRPWIAGAVVLVAGGLFELCTLDAMPTVPGVALLVVTLTAVTVALIAWSRRPGWSAGHRLAAAGGALLTYAWHSFFSHPVAGGSAVIVPISHTVFAVLAVLLLVLVARRPSPGRTTPAPSACGSRSSSPDSPGHR